MCETLVGLVLFLDVDWYPTWIHPDPHILYEAYGSPGAKEEARTRPKYEALSYTWGAPRDQQTAFVLDGDSGLAGGEPSRLPIGNNPGSAIRHLRHPDCHRVF
jgi:hypothetical protein